MSTLFYRNRQYFYSLHYSGVGLSSFYSSPRLDDPGNYSAVSTITTLFLARAGQVSFGVKTN